MEHNGAMYGTSVVNNMHYDTACGFSQHRHTKYGHKTNMFAICTSAIFILRLPGMVPGKPGLLLSPNLASRLSLASRIAEFLPPADNRGCGD